MRCSMYLRRSHCTKGLAIPGIRSTFGTGTELLNSLRLMYSRLASHRCPNGHYLAPFPGSCGRQGTSLS